jgi:Arc/MetJ-type ribon-helix-helix transcriptional regulator
MAQPLPKEPREIPPERLGEIVRLIRELTVDIQWDPPTLRAAGPARKVSVSLPEDLTAAVQQRVGHGKFSQYVTEAVTRQLEQDLLTELSDLLTAQYGPYPDEYLDEAIAAWPDAD